VDKTKEATVAEEKMDDEDGGGGGGGGTGGDSVMASPKPPLAPSLEEKVRGNVFKVSEGISLFGEKMRMLLARARSLLHTHTRAHTFVAYIVVSGG